MAELECPENEQVKVYLPLGLVHLLGCFLILLAGSSVAFLVLLLENLKGTVFANLSSIKSDSLTQCTIHDPETLQ